MEFFYRSAFDRDCRVSHGVLMLTFMNYVKPERIITITRSDWALYLIVTYEQRKDVGIPCAPSRASRLISRLGRPPVQKSDQGMSCLCLRLSYYRTLSQSNDSCDSTSTILKGNSFRDIKKTLPGSRCTGPFACSFTRRCRM